MTPLWQKRYNRLYTFIATVPFLSGVFAVLNILDDFEFTLSHVISPLVSMHGIGDVYGVTIHSIHQSELFFLAFVGVISAESVLSILSFLGKVIMLQNIHREMVATGHGVLHHKV